MAAWWSVAAVNETRVAMRCVDLGTPAGMSGQTGCFIGFSEGLSFAMAWVRGTLKEMAASRNEPSRIPDAPAFENRLALGSRSAHHGSSVAIPNLITRHTSLSIPARVGEASNMKQFQPWLSPPDLQAPIGQTSAEQLRYQLRVVRSWLERATRPTKDAASEDPARDVVAIHQLRVWIRRTLATLTLYQAIVPEKQVTKTQHMLRSIARSANRVRSRDVLLARLESWPESESLKAWQKSLRKKRRQGKTQFDQEMEFWTKSKGFARRVRRLLTRLEACEDPDQVALASAPFAQWAPIRFRDWIETYFAQLPAVDDLEALHRFRLQGKQVRYAMEHLAAVFPKVFRKRLYGRMQKLQERLGDLNDQSSMVELLQSRLEASSSLPEATYWQRHFYAEQSKLKRMLKRTQRWLTEDSMLELRNEFLEAIRTVPQS